MRNRLPLILFFLSGFSSLAYELCWVRQATLTFGVSIYAYSATLAAYMTGMALGGYLFGRPADRTSHPWRLMAWLQVGLALLGVTAWAGLGGLSQVYAGLVRNLDPDATALTSLRLGMAMLALVPSALCIGALWPVMSRAYATHAGRVGGDLGRLYAANTLGSVLGCASTALFLIRLLGLRETTFMAAAVSLLVAGLAEWLSRATSRCLGVVDSPNSSISAGIARSKSAKARHAQDQVVPPPQPTRRALHFLLWAYALSGFAALGYEVVWARIISLHTVGAIYSFAVMLTVFLAGLLVGSMLGTWWVKCRRTALFHFGVLELGIGLLAVLALFAFAQLPRISLEDLFGGYSLAAEIALETLYSLITLFPVTVLIGMAFPVVSSIYTAEQPTGVGGRMARVTALNTAGSVLGSLVTGFLIVPALGLQRSALVLAALNVGIGLTAVWAFPATLAATAHTGVGPRRASARPESRSRLVATAVAVLALVLMLWLPSPLYLGHWQDEAEHLIFYREGVETTVAVFAPSADHPKFSTVNGRVEVPTDVLSLRAFYMLGHLPALLHPDAQSALMLSFGNGIATGALASHQIPLIEVVELSPEMIEAAQVYAAENRGVLQYPGLKIHVEDARNFLLQTGQRYDIITTDATHPTNASSWTLFTAEFYGQIAQHLNPDGVFLQWVPLHSMAVADYLAILRTFQSVFPTATLWYTGGTHTLLLATPDRLTRAGLQEKLWKISAPAVLQDLGSSEQIARHWIMDDAQLREFVGPGRIIEDNNAFLLPINTETAQLVSVIQLAAIRAGGQ